jgi:hypothetical protein
LQPLRGARRLDLPDLVLRRRQATPQPAAVTGVVFPTQGLLLRDPHNTSGDLRKILDRAGFHWVTSVVGERFERGAVAQGRVQPSAVVEDLDVLRDGEPGTRPGGEGVPVVHLVLQGREK